MSKQQEFYICKHCGNIMELIIDSGVPVVCCGENMSVLTANTTDAAVEKHVPAVRVSGNTVTVEVGSAPHPMTEAHYIQWVYIQTEKGVQHKSLSPNDKPEAVFALTDDDTLVRTFAYCNLHSLWVTEEK